MESAQDAVLRLIEPLELGNAEGVEVVQALRALSGEWIAALPAHSRGPGATLRALRSSYAVDTLYILCHRLRAPLMRAAAAEWQPTEVTTLHGAAMQAWLGSWDEPTEEWVVLRVYWAP
jgi:hypothetical protein